MALDLYASRSHYADHLWPIWLALPARLRGHTLAPRPSWWGAPTRRTDLPDHTMVAAYVDAQHFGFRPLVYVEHGAGQAYVGDPRAAVSGSYSGGEGLGHVRLFIAPSRMVAERWWARYPSTLCAVVGCPRLDPWHQAGRRPPGDPPTVAWAFHWHADLCPEMRPALNHYRPWIRACTALWAAKGWRVVGHGHPREEGLWRRLWAEVGIPYLTSSQEIFDQADVLVCDNSSLLYEFASLDRPVVVLNAPWYRRHVEHGLRFWSLIPGPQVNDGPQLYDFDLDVLLVDEADRANRKAVIEQVYAFTDGRAAERAALAIDELLGG